MEPQIIDYYNEMPSGINVIDKMNEELDELQKKYDALKQRYEPDDELQGCIRRACNTHYDMSVLIHKLYQDKFRCTSIKHNEWYFYDDEEKKWRLSDGAVELRMKLSNEVLKMFEHLAFKEISSEGSNTADFYKTIYHQTYSKLKSPTYKNTIIKECKDIFYDRDFLKNIPVE